jgi:xanthine dehydrogenase small subunit
MKTSNYLQPLAKMRTQVPSQPLSLLHRATVVTLPEVAVDRTLLQVLREDLACKAPKEGCTDGACGACGVVLGHEVGGVLRYQAVNSCMRMAHSVHGMAVWTAQDIAAPSACPALEDLHPVQAAMVQCHASQCGFCTPGVVMALFALYQSTAGAPGLDHAQAQAALSGNLCRCTGYRPMVEAAQTMGALPLPAGCKVDEAALLAALRALRAAKSTQAVVPAGVEVAVQGAAHGKADGAGHAEHVDEYACSLPYLRPTRLLDLLQWRAAKPRAQLIAGATDVAVRLRQTGRRLTQVLDTTATAELQQVHLHGDHVAIGAAVCLHDAFAALLHERPALAPWAQRFSSVPVRNTGTLGGNVVQGGATSDCVPLLIALGASVVLMRWDPLHHGGAVRQRELYVEDLYAQGVQLPLQPDEVVVSIKVPRVLPGENLQVYKVSKRFEQDTLSVALAVRMTFAQGRVQTASLGVGGVAATAVRAQQTERVLCGQAWSLETVQRAVATLRAEFDPPGDGRASAAYRRTVLGNLLLRYGFASQCESGISTALTLDALRMDGEFAAGAWL